MIKQIQKIKDIVHDLLISKPHTRDCDKKLMANVWSKEIGGIKTLTNISGYDFLKYFSEGKLSSPESIRRARQKIQEENEDLRGATYFERQHLANLTRKEIN